MESCSNQKSYSKWPPFALMTALHTLRILSTSFMSNAFSTVLKDFPHMLSTYWMIFFYSAVQLIPNQLNWVEVRGLWRPGHLMQHHPSPSWSNSTYTAWRCVGSLSFEKQMALTRRDGVSLTHAVSSEQLMLRWVCSLNSAKHLFGLQSKVQ